LEWFVVGSSNQLTPDERGDVGVMWEDALVKLLVGLIGVALSGTLFFLIRRIITGELVPRQTLLDIVTPLIKERDDWKAAAETSREQVHKLVDQGDITIDLLTSLHRVADGEEGRT
jgi:hypothetical protein